MGQGQQIDFALLLSGIGLFIVIAEVFGLAGAPIVLQPLNMTK